jgi:dolichol-phosphate mannosyltransferase
LAGNNIDFRLIFIEDGSSDNTIDLLRELSTLNDRVKYFSLSHPYGQGFALSFGISKSDADAVITLDADGSHPFETIKLMINENSKGYNVVQGHRIVYDREKRFRKYFSYIFNGVFSLISGVNFLKQNVHFRLMDRKARSIFTNNKRWWYSARVNFKDSEIKSTLVEFTAPERSLGESKFNFLRLLKIAVRLSYNLISFERFLVLSSLLIGLIVFITYLVPVMIIFSPIILINFYFYFRFNNDNLSQYKILENSK